MRYTIVTNNRLVRDKDGQYPLAFVNGDAEAVLDTAATMLQTGWALLNCPLPPNVALIRSPIRSLVLEKKAQNYDVQGLLQLEKARERIQTLHKTFREAQREDLEIIDRTFMYSALDTLGIADSKAF